MIRYFITLIGLVTWLMPQVGQSQVYLQIEQPFTTETRRYVKGDHLKYRLRDFEKEWMEQDIVNIIYDGQSVLFADKLVSIKDITHIQYPRPFYKQLGSSLQVFGGSWLIMGGLIQGLESSNALGSDTGFGWDTLAIGLGSIASGYIIRKALGQSTRKMGRNNRLNIIDTNF